MTTRSEKRRNVMIDLLVCLGIPIIQMAAREYRPFTPDQVVYAEVTQNTLFRDIAMTYSRMSGHCLRSTRYRKRLFCISHGLWRSAVYLSFIVVRILAYHHTLIPSLI